MIWVHAKGTVSACAALLMTVRNTAPRAAPMKVPRPPVSTAPAQETGRKSRQRQPQAHVVAADTDLRCEEDAPDHGTHGGHDVAQCLDPAYGHANPEARLLAETHRAAPQATTGPEQPHVDGQRDHENNHKADRHETHGAREVQAQVHVDGSPGLRTQEDAYAGDDSECSDRGYEGADLEVLSEQ